MNTPLPRWWLLTFYACIVWAFGYWIVYPACPMLWRSTTRPVAYSFPGEPLPVELEISKRYAARKWYARRASLADIEKDPALLALALCA